MLVSFVNPILLLQPGYILQPPCLWGDGPGLEPMHLASGVPFMIKAITNSTYGHHGEMAFPEVTLVPWNKETNQAEPGLYIRNQAA